MHNVKAEMKVTECKRKHEDLSRTEPSHVSSASKPSSLLSMQIAQLSQIRGLGNETHARNNCKCYLKPPQHLLTLSESKRECKASERIDLAFIGKHCKTCADQHASGCRTIKMPMQGSSKDGCTAGPLLSFNDRNYARALVRLGLSIPSVERARFLRRASGASSMLIRILLKKMHLPHLDLQTAMSALACELHISCYGMTYALAQTQHAISVMNISLH